MGWQAIAPTLIQGGISAAGNMFSAQQARRATESNRRWAEFMSGTEIQRRKADLEAAGFNPMLAFNDQASTPSVASAQVPDFGNVARSMEFASNKLALAQARKTEAEAKMIEADLPYSGFNARIRSNNLSRQEELLREQINDLKATWQGKVIANDIAELDAQQRAQLQPLLVEYQKYMNTSAALDIPKAQAEAKFWERFEDFKNAGFLRDLFFLLRGALK